MSHLDFIRPGGQWPGEIVPGSGDYQRLDDHQSRIVNGDGGGLYLPKSPIVIGGAGLVLSSTGSLINGGATTTTGGRVALKNVGTNNTPILSAPATDRIVVPLTSVHAPIADSTNASQLPDDYTTPGVATTVGIQAGATSTVLVFDIPPRYLHQGASFALMKFSFRIISRPVQVPPSGIPLTFQPFAWSADGSSGLTVGMAPADLLSWVSGETVVVGQYTIPTTPNATGFYYRCTNVGSGTTGTTEPTWPTVVGNSTAPDSNGVVWVCAGRSGQMPAATDAATYFNNGQPQALYFDFDNSTGPLVAANAIDTTTYHYAIAIGGMQDYGNVSALNLVAHSLEIHFSNIVDLRFE